MFVSNEARKPTPLADADGVEKLAVMTTSKTSMAIRILFFNFYRLRWTITVSTAPTNRTIATTRIHGNNSTRMAEPEFTVIVNGLLTYAKVGPLNFRNSAVP